MRKLTSAFAGAFASAFAGVATAAAVIAALIGLAAAPAFADVNSVVVSGNTNADGSFSAAATSPTFSDTTSGFVLECVSATTSGGAPNGTYPGGGAATLTSLSWSGCSVAGITYTFTPGHFPWQVIVTGPTVGGVTPIAIPGIEIVLSGACNAILSGTATGSYDNNTHLLTIDGGDLTVSGVSGLCLGLINNGDSVVIHLVFSVSPPLEFNAT